MLVIGERVNDGNRARLRKYLEVPLGIRADDHTVNVARQCPRRVSHGFAAAHLDIVCGEIERRTAELANAHFKTHPRAGTGLVENERPDLAFERLRLPGLATARLEFLRKLENVADLTTTELLDCQ